LALQGDDNMPVTITKIRLLNYKRFSDYTIEPNSRFNILVGDNEVGKSSVLEAIDLVASGNVRKVETIGIDKLFNIEAVKNFTAGVRTFDNLPQMIIELYLDLGGTPDFTMNGRNNLSRIQCDGIRLVCKPNQDYTTEIMASMHAQADYFPYDYYSIRFSTFADEGYSGYKKKLRTILIDSSNMNSEYATNDFIKRMYHRHTEDDMKERAVHRSKYRQLKEGFRSDSLRDLNARMPADKKYTFGLKSTAPTEFENNLMIFEDEVGIDSKGTGKQVFIKTDFALERSGANIDVILLEEPENHLSPANLRKLIQRVSEARSGQLFITTHNSLISTRLELQNLLIMYEHSGNGPTSLHNLQEDTAKYFMKAPVASIVEFAVGNRSILVEGPSEYMLFERFYEIVTEHKPETDNVRIIDIHGLSFKRYLEVAKILNSRVAVVTDNDHDVQKKCIEKYRDYAGYDNIKICYEADESKKTFEIVLYYDNEELCTQLFGNDALNFMLGNKTEAAYILLTQAESICVPQYIQEAITWIKE